MTQLSIKTGTEADFFKDGRALARAADQGAPLPESRIISFEDPAELMKLVSTARLALLRMVKESPSSITAIALRLQRDRSAVKRDIDALQRAGLLTVAVKVLPGHGRTKEVRATAHRFSLVAELA